MNYDQMSNEQLIMALTQDTGDGFALEELTRRFRPVILGEALKYRGQLPFDTDDYLQEGRIILWQIAEKKNFNGGNFRNYFVSAVRFRFCNLYRDYVLKNYIRIGGYEDCRGNTYEILVEAAFARQYREKHSQYCKELYAKKKAEECARLGIPLPKPRVKLTEEELAANRRARSKAYYYAHREEIRRKAKARKAAKQAVPQPCPV